MSALTITVNDTNLAKAITQVPDLLAKNMANAVLRSSKEMARTARRLAPEAFGTLKKSIKDKQISSYEAIIAPLADYAQLVEEGTAGGGRMPNRDTIQDWIERKNIQPNDPFMDTRDLSFIMARSIAAKGTPAQPYLKPAFEDNKARAERRINRAINNALKGKKA